MKTTKSRKRMRYTVWDNKTDSVVAVDETADKCAELMGVSFHSFYNIVDRSANGLNKRWTILKKDALPVCMSFPDDVSSIAKMPYMVQLVQLAGFFQTNTYQLERFCKKNAVTIVRAGARKIKFVERDIFFTALKREVL